MAKWIKRTVKTCLLAPVGAVAVGAVLLYVPPVQNAVLKVVLRHVSERVGMEITVGHVRLSSPLDLTLRDVSTHCSMSEGSPSACGRGPYSVERCSSQSYSWTARWCTAKG